jgi:hypothetical protein
MVKAGWARPRRSLTTLTSTAPRRHPRTPDHEEPTVTHQEILDELRQPVKDLRDHLDGGPVAVHAPRAFEAVREFAEQ